jgi:phospholipid transport system substrate-binding protein
MSRRFFALMIAFTLTAMPLRAEAPGPSGVVTEFQATLVAVMKEAKNLAPKARYDRLAPAIDRAFHPPTMVRVILGPRWETTPADQRDALLHAFRRMSIATLATLFDGYSGETFTVVKEEPGPQNTTLVETSLRKSDGDTVSIAYFGKTFKEGWRVVDVIVDKGISELTVRRSEYKSILESGGVPALIETLNKKADSLLTS